MTCELTKDVVELEKLRQSSIRPNVQNFLDAHIAESKRRLEDLKRTEAAAAASKLQSSSPDQGGTAGALDTTNRPIKKLTTYAFDESEKFVKLYYTLPGAETIAPENIVAYFHTNSFDVLCKNINGIDYAMSAKGLMHPLDWKDKKCMVKPKTGMLLVILKKKEEHRTWDSLLKLEQDKKETKTPKMDEGADPQESLMKMMKQMYDEGDDQMKQTIRKSWYESSQKKGAGMGMGGMNMDDF